MKKYEDRKKECILFTDLNDAAIARYQSDLAAAESVKKEYTREYKWTTASVKKMARRAKRQCEEEKSRREWFASNTLDDLQRIMSEIKDPHFHRMERKYSRDIRNYHENMANDTADDLREKVREELEVLQESVDRLNQAFLPPVLSSAIGAVAPGYRKSQFKQIIALRNKILDEVELLLDDSELEALRLEAEQTAKRRIREERACLEQKLAVLPGQMREKKQQVLELYHRGLQALSEETGIFQRPERGILYGFYTYRTRHMPLLRETDLNKMEVNTRDDTSFQVPVYLDSLQGDYLYVYSGKHPLNDHFISTALDLLLTNGENEVIFVDVKGIGSEYAVLNKLTAAGQVEIWSTENQVAAGLIALENWILSVYRETLADRYYSVEEYNATQKRKKPETYIFIHDIKANIDKNDFEKLIRIVKNGKRAGVYVIAAVALEDCQDRMLYEVFQEIQADMQRIAIEDMVIPIRKNASVMLKTGVDRRKLNTVYSYLEEKRKQQEIIPLGKYLPPAGHWHEMSAEKEIVIPFGMDTNGKTAVLKFSSEKPYAMIIGDPRHGKSKLMHAMIMMATSRYSEKEVKVGVMDLKDGAEFNIYARAGLQAVECVMNDEDPDAMLSFLKYYVAQMHSRQELFERMEEATGSVVQKYEDYRAANRHFAAGMPAMPRLLLLIDEFQTLFDGAASSLFMSELVRKGATYGIHVVLSSQRAVSSNPRNGFSTDLKDYFTSRFVFKCPQSAAKTVLSDRCADTGRENSGIHKAALLKPGYVIYNSYMGQNEADNREVQCFYASTELVARFVQVLAILKGGAPEILRKKNAKSEYPKAEALDGNVYLGDSVKLHCDLATGSNDFIKDDMTVSFSMESALKNILVTGNDVRVVESLVGAVKRFAEQNKEPVLLQVFGETESLKKIAESQYFQMTEYRNTEEQLETLKNLEKSELESDEDRGYTVNLFLEPDQYEEYMQSPGGLRKSRGVELLKKAFTSREKGFSIVCSKNFKNIRNTMPYLVNEVPVRIVSVGDYENLRMSTSENVHFTAGDFDIPRRDAIKAYYYNKETEKHGKMVMYLP